MPQRPGSRSPILNEISYATLAGFVLLPLGRSIDRPRIANDARKQMDL